MELSNYLRALRKHRLLIATLTLLGTALGYGLYLLTPAVYSSSVTFYVSTPLSEGNNPLSAGEFAQARVNSYVALLESEQLANRVIRDQRLPLTTAEVRQQISASAELNTVLVKAEVLNHSPQQSLAVARGVATTFGPMVDTLDNQGRKSPTVVINVVSGPTLALTPVSPDRRLYAGLGLLCGAALAALIAVLRELLDSTVRSVDLATALVRAPVIGSIPFDPRIRKAPLLLGGTGTTRRGEAFRQLRTNLQFVQAAASAEVLMVTSAQAQEGKTSTAADLALSFVELGHRVLLIEADLRRPTLSHHLGIAGSGLTDVLVGQVEVDDVIQQWHNAGLSVLPSGTNAPNPAELLGSAQMAGLVKTLRSSYDHVILDTPPLLPVTDAVVCAGLVDGVVLVVRSGKTHRSSVAAAANALRAVDAHILGVVLSMTKVSRSDLQAYASPMGAQKLVKPNKLSSDWPVRSDKPVPTV